MHLGLETKHLHEQFTCIKEYTGLENSVIAPVIHLWYMQTPGPLEKVCPQRRKLQGQYSVGIWCTEA